MLLKVKTLEGIQAGDVTLVFRRWQKPTVRAGGSLRTRIGVIEIGAVDVVAAGRITASDAKRAGYATKRELLDELDRREGTTYRIEVRMGGADPRISLRKSPIRNAEEMAEIEARLARTDKATRGGAWTRQVLEMIEGQSGVRAPDLAASMGLETKPFKQRVRRLKELGLTESLAVGYRLSPRGRSYLERLRGR